jgi:hypothetical protein
VFTWISRQVTGIYPGQFRVLYCKTASICPSVCSQVFMEFPSWKSLCFSLKSCLLCVRLP